MTKIWNKGIKIDPIKYPNMFKPRHAYSDEFRKKSSESHKGQVAWNKGKKMSKEYVEKNRLAHIGIKHSEEARLRKSISVKKAYQEGKRKSYWKGKKFSEEHRKKIGLSGLGKKYPFRKRTLISEETKRKISLANMGKKISEETRKRLSESHIGKPSGRKGIKTGKHSYNWIEDRTKLKMSDRMIGDSRARDWSKEVKKKDGWICRIADINCDGKLESHHILPWSKFPELRYQINNGITLCHAHHPRKQNDVQKLSPYFQRLVASLD